MIAVQCAPGLNEVPTAQLVDATRNSLGDAASVPRSKGALPVLLSVTAKPGATAPKPVAGSKSAVSLSCATGSVMVGMTPVPTSDTAVVLGDALWLIDSIALLVPAALGVNATVSMQFAPGTSVAPTVQLLMVAENSGLDTVMALIVRLALPVLVNVHS